MASTDSRRRRRAIFWLSLSVIVLIYIGLVVTSTQSGLAAGFQRDIQAQRDLLRALNYASEQSPAGGFTNDAAQPRIAGLDLGVLQAEMGGGNLIAEGPTAPSPSGPAPGATPDPNGGTTPPPQGGGTAPNPPPQPQPSQSTQPPVVGPSPSPIPTSSPTACNPPTGNGHMDGQVRNAANKQNIGGATVNIYWNGCPVATGTSKSDGHLITRITNLARNMTYTYTVSAPGYVSGSGSFTTAGDGNTSAPLLLGS